MRLDAGMSWNRYILRELWEQKGKFMTSAIAIILAVAVIIAVHTITTYSAKAISKEMDALGANILILSPHATLVDYYSADLQTGELPEEYVTLLTTSNLEGLDNLSPKLSLPLEIEGSRVIVTGILPKNEFQSKAMWQGAGVFSRPKGCGNVDDIFGLAKKAPKETLVRKRVIETLEANEILVGRDVATKLGMKEGDAITLFDKPFSVSAILPQTGTIDDGRIFMHLHTLQDLSGKDAVIHAIEVVGCCEQISNGLVTKIQSLLPNSKVITISQIVDTQIKANQLMQSLSLLFFAIVITMGGAGVANEMYNNVQQRRKEIGTLASLGVSSRTILQIFLKKALLLGLFGALTGYVLGTIVAVILGPLIAGVPVLPLFYMLFVVVGLSVSMTIVASFLPARFAAKLDPCTLLQEN